MIPSYKRPGLGVDIELQVVAFDENDLVILHELQPVYQSLR